MLPPTVPAPAGGRVWVLGWQSRVDKAGVGRKVGVSGRFAVAGFVLVAFGVYCVAFVAWTFGHWGGLNPALVNNLVPLPLGLAVLVAAVRTACRLGPGRQRL